MSDRKKDAAKRRGEARTAQVEIRVREAMREIEKEMGENGSIYPQNGGAISMNEVARRAKISLTTLFSPKQQALGRQVKTWIDQLKENKITGRTRVRRAFQERADDWRKKFLDLQDVHRATELELQDSLAELEKCKRDADDLRTKNQLLLEQCRLLGTSMITRIPEKH
ncbi:hypothetical protein [Duganella sacchari]|uniref:hypothetical protein n=1 Tax=Duganella sacchari TaxID=551987 RepID=UPI0009326E75|nr:hypothetical protein [Duganella sacchari]